MIKMECIIYEKKNDIGYITFKGPKGNAINHKMACEMADLMNNTLINEKDIKVLVLKGHGNNFMYGADVSEFLQSDDRFEGTTGNARLFMRGLKDIDPFCIAAIYGYALGGGLEVALACDFIIASNDAKFGFPEINFGIIPGAGGTQLLPRIIGYKRATQMILTGKEVDAMTAKDYGLVDVICERDTLMSCVLGKCIGQPKKRQISVFDKNDAKRGIKEGNTATNKPKYAIKAAIECIKASVHDLDFSKEAEEFRKLVKYKETQNRIRRFLKG